MQDALTDVRLENGLRVVMKQDYFTNIVGLQCWVQAGSLYETPDEHGMAHLVEHMLFKGTQRRQVGEISRLVEGCGGDINAYTTFDATVYYLTLGRDHADLGVDILADAMFDSAIDPSSLTVKNRLFLKKFDLVKIALVCKSVERYFLAYLPVRKLSGQLLGLWSLSQLFQGTR